jgi:hypothetical protein
MVDVVTKIISESSTKIVTGNIRSVARTIVSTLAHAYDMVPISLVMNQFKIEPAIKTGGKDDTARTEGDA